MKLPVNIIRVLVGLLFIFSGLVKANDPLGLSYKMQEFFDLWGISQFNRFTLSLSVLMNAFEIIAGFALIIGWRIRLFIWLLLLLIIFFTVLTGYAYFSGKFRNCGCFGDCIPISAGASFVKDLVLLLLIGFLFFNQRWIRPWLSGRMALASILAVALLSFGLQWYTLRYLPLMDCLPFKKGNNLPEKMKVPEGSRPDSFAIRFIYEKGGKQYEFAPAELPADLATYTLVKRIDKLVRKGNAEPAIKDLSFKTISGQDSTTAVLSVPRTLLLFCENFSRPVSAWSNSFNKVYTAAAAGHIPVYLITSHPDEAAVALQGTAFSGIPVLVCDFTAIRTAARTNPCLYYLENGTVEGKWSKQNFDAALKAMQ